MDHLAAHLQMTIRYGLHRTVGKKKHMLSTQKKEYQEKPAGQLLSYRLDLTRT